MTTLLSKDHTILERPFMECRPFGVDEHGEKIRDISGVSVRAMVQYMERIVAIHNGLPAGEEAVQQICRLLNERIRDSAYAVTPAYLRNAWHSYSYEFVCYVYEFCWQLSGDPRFPFNAGKDKVSPMLQILGRPFSLDQIFRMWPHFGNKYSSGVIEYEVRTVTNASAVLRMRFTERSYQQFGPYRKRCADMICQSHHGSLSALPELIHRMPPAMVTDRQCIAAGDACCEWEVIWAPTVDTGLSRFIKRVFAFRQDEKIVT